MELRSRFRSVKTAELPIQAGDIVKFKRGVATLTHDPVMIVWRLLDENNKQDWALIVEAHHHSFYLERLDCIIGCLEPDGITVRTYCFRTQSPVCSSGRAVLITPIRP